MRFYVAKYVDNGRLMYWSGSGHLFVTEPKYALSFNVSDAQFHAIMLHGFIIPV